MSENGSEEDNEFKKEAWKLHFKETRKNYIYKRKKINNKYNIKWIKKKEEGDLIEKWLQVKTLNENFEAEEERKRNEKSKPFEVNANVRRSNRLYAQLVTEKDTDKKMYTYASSKDCSSDNELEQDETKI